MKKFFSKDSFVISTFDKKQRLQSLIVSIALIVFFAFSAFTFFNAMYAFADCIGSIVSGSADAALRDAGRSVPLFLSCFMSIWALLLVHGLFRNVSDEKRIKSLKKNAIALLAFAFVNLVAIIVMLIMGKFHSLVEGAPSPFYPLDSILYSLIFVALGIFALLYVSKLQEKLPYVVPSRGPVVSKLRGLYCTFMSFWMLIALYSFASFAIGLFILDFGHYFFFSFALTLVYFINCLFLVVWELYFNELKEEKKKEFLLPLAAVGLIVSIVVAAIYLIGLGTNLDAPSNAGFGVLPVAFAASVNIATLIIVFTPLIVSVVALIKGLIIRKKA